VHVFMSVLVFNKVSAFWHFQFKRAQSRYFELFWPRAKLPLRDGKTPKRK